MIERQFLMDAIAAGQTYMIPERFDKAVKLIRSALAKTELSIVGELDTTETLRSEFGKNPERSTILFVDCPLAVFEAQALDRAAAVFFPLHVFVWGDGDRTSASAFSSAGLFDNRLPLGSADPIKRLEDRISVALKSVLARSGANDQEEGNGK
jgi:uncharacterized protein (DUF302 family)